ncbi:MAG: restriction endonuclease [Polaromonas sp.]|nr:restriction endonuclease [Polaromonas sp.]MDP3357210.1 restriction endonuclease [Polaromonas sp.]MDP3750568.1 restriction endonuclease [Polaromonas sp.]
MVASTPRKPVQAKAPAQSPFSFLFVIGLLALAAGVVLLLLSFKNRALRPVGGALLLIGVVLAGGYLTNRIISGIYVDPLAYEPPWAKLGRGDGPPRLPAPGKPAAPEDKPFEMDKLIDFPVADAPRRPVAPVNRPVASPPPVRSGWTTEIFDFMTPQQFDAVCATLFAQSGLETRAQSHGAAGGVTIWLHSRNAQQGKDSPVAVALCKLWPGQPLLVRDIHPLLTLMAARGLKRATYATGSSFTENASEFAKNNGINALDRFGLLKLIATRTPAQQQQLLAIALARR